MYCVALLAEGVDRNLTVMSPGTIPSHVALLAEGVDRNATDDVLVEFRDGSPSSRRAWIEIGRTHKERWTVGVALLAEGVDRNTTTVSIQNQDCQSPSSRRAWIEIARPLVGRIWPESPSSRRAWIEIPCHADHQRRQLVALLAEGVDRNNVTYYYVFNK